MNVEKYLAAVALGAYLVYALAFYAEGHKPRGSAALKTLAYVAEPLVFIALIWVLVT